MQKLYSYLSPKLRLAILLAIFAILLSLYVSNNIKSNENTTPGTAQNNDAIAKIEKMPGLLNVPLKKILNNEERVAEDKSDTRLTERAARDLIYTYISAKQNGKNTEELQKLIENEVERVLNVQIRTYKKDDLRLDGSFSIRGYKNDMKKALRPLANIKEYELESIAKYIKDNDSVALENIKKDIEIYTKTIVNLLQVPINEELEVPHLALVNAYSKLLASLQLISESKNDIMLVYPGLKLFLEADAEIYSAFDALKLYVEKEI